MNRNWIGALLVLALGASASAGAMSFPPFMPPSRSTEKPHPAIEKLRDYSATIHTSLGDMEIAFGPEDAPNAVRNFIKLALKGAYDGSRFDCIFKGKMVFAGAPKGDAAQTIGHERSPLGNKAGTLAMDTVPRDPKDRFAAKKNSGSRFFINVVDQHHLDDDYTVFARITGAKGLDVAERIGQARTRPKDGQPTPIEDIVIERITITKKTEEKKKDGPPGKPGDGEKK
ncbi:peptidylprolyl isomerase [Planctomycetota bacterium]